MTASSEVYEALHDVSAEDWEVQNKARRNPTLRLKEIPTLRGEGDVASGSSRKDSCHFAFRRKLHATLR